MLYCKYAYARERKSYGCIRRAVDCSNLIASMATVVALAALGSAVLLDVVATVLLVRSPVATPLQKAFQLIFTWAVPFVGRSSYRDSKGDNFHPKSSSWVQCLG